MEFQVIIGLQDQGLHEDFKDAFREFWEEIKVRVKNGVSITWIDTNFIVIRDSQGSKLVEVPLNFFKVKELGYCWHLINHAGEIVNNFEEVTISKADLIRTYNEILFDQMSEAHERDFHLIFNL